MTTNPPSHPLHRLRNLVGSSLLTLEALTQLRSDLPPEVRRDLEQVMTAPREAGRLTHKMSEEQPRPAPV
jgi:hypothetical protein